MNNKIINELKRGSIFFSIIFTITTLVSSSLQLIQGQTNDPNFHILNRGAVIFIAVVTITLFDKIKLRNKILSYFVPYAISMTIVFLYVWITGFIEPLHQNAYRDIFLNFTAVAVCVMIILQVKDKWMENKGTNKAKIN